MPIESGPSQEEEILDEDEEGDPEAEDVSEARDACSQELVSTLEEASQLQLFDLGEAQIGKDLSERAAHWSTVRDLFLQTEDAECMEHKLLKDGAKCGRKHIAGMRSNALWGIGTGPRMPPDPSAFPQCLAAEEEEMLCGIAAQNASLRIPLQVPQV
ncbi:hypothetical protein UY3_14737 [Chelonia mydas]|uniref:Uncharacterized protein n=1 Tax=Chelonia mydas TaxID=8469 RepID=M7BIL4_CHEMY|nr:hypothetical protein UY3_14737 [Chelonia mydas]